MNFSTLCKLGRIGIGLGGGLGGRIGHGGGIGGIGGRIGFGGVHAAVILSLEPAQSFNWKMNFSTIGLGGGLGGRISTGGMHTANGQLRKAIYKSLPAVVEITAINSWPDLEIGTGFVIGDKGLIVTCCHVVERSEGELVVKFVDGYRVLANIVLKDRASDLAVLQIENVDDLTFHTMKTGLNGGCYYGDEVFTIGHPANLPFSVSTGIVSYPRRKRCDMTDFMQSQVDTFIQTNFVVYTGNSGGPLINNKGDAIGVVGSKHRSGGIVFSYPIEHVWKILVRAIKTGNQV